ncbi:uncharacterized protein LOC118658228 [Myotis myotis]|uniref:uncharacterized protein LOC118658228 n=1 Tax=Myotis myotis TaxID=51298 RepID=UPI0017488C89|nr:uncharacterized protein LOC118658228 [Myotis myotis]
MPAPHGPRRQADPVHLSERKQESSGTCGTSAGTVPAGPPAGFLHPGRGPTAQEALQALILELRVSASRQVHKGGVENSKGLCFPRSPSAPERLGLPSVPLRATEGDRTLSVETASGSHPLFPWTHGAEHEHFLGPMLAGQTISDELQEMTHVTCPSHTVESARACRTQGTGLGAQTVVVAAAEGQRWPNVTQHMGLLISLGRTRSLHPAIINPHEGFPLSSVGADEQESPAQCCPRQLSWDVLHWKCKCKVRKGEMGHIKNEEPPPPPAAVGLSKPPFL